MKLELPLTPLELVFNDESPVTHPPPPGYKGEPITITGYRGECKLTSLDLTALNIVHISFFSIPRCITKLYLDRAPDTEYFNHDLREIYINHCYKSVRHYRRYNFHSNLEAKVFINVCSFDILDSCTERIPVNFFTADLSVSLRALSHPNFNNNGLVPFTNEFGRVIAKCSFTLKSSLTPSQALLKDFNTLKQESIEQARAASNDEPIQELDRTLFRKFESVYNVPLPYWYCILVGKIVSLCAKIESDIENGRFHYSVYNLDIKKDEHYEGSLALFRDFLPAKGFYYDKKHKCTYYDPRKH